ncbi:MAG: hypothetical protein IJW57_00820 [Spirochaetaceae bacterium]|nr:hypothetical protein [Spirochaetaceae bacterium]
MSKRLNEAKALRRGAITALIIITILMSGCGNPVGGVENNPLADFVGKTYKSQHDELFTVAAPDTIKLGFGTDYSTKGKIVASKSTDAGTVYLLECSTHSNYSPSQYPDFNEENPHSGCYLPVYVRSITGETVEWAAFSSKTGAQGEGQYGSACFAAGSKDKATEYLDLTQWNPQPMTSTGTVQ